MQSNSPSAALIIIGNEILSGRTEDKNLNFLALELNQLGIKFAEVRVVADITDQIIDAVNSLRTQHDYIFTTGGIGPTHDDITADAIAKAFKVDLITNDEALKMLEDYYGEEHLNQGRVKMAKTPNGARLIVNKISVAPGFAMENVYVMAGIPNVMHAMFEALKGELTSGAIVQSIEETIYASESQLAPHLTELQETFPTVEVGSYPFVEENTFGVSIVLRSSDDNDLSASHEALKNMLKEFESAV